MTLGRDLPSPIRWHHPGGLHYSHPRLPPTYPMSLNALVTVRSQRALGLEAYLQAFVGLTAWPRSPFLGDRKLIDVYQPPDVVRWDRLHADARARRREGDRRGEFVQDDERVERVPWRGERRRLWRAVILGPPGEGKTTLTQLTCRAVARVSLRALRRQTAALSDLAIPVWLRVQDVLQAGSLEDAARRVVARQVTDAVKQYTPNPQPRPSAPPAVDHIVEALNRKSTWVFLDALDERPKEADQDAAQALRGLARLPGRVIFTSRPYTYDLQRTDLPFRSAELSEYILTPLTSEQQESFILRRWFRHDASTGSRVRDLVADHPAFRDLATNALLLTLICATAERHRRVNLAALRRVHLYDLVVRDVVRRAHKPKRVTDPREIKNRMRVLAQAAWRLFQHHAAERIFSDDDWDTALDAACRAAGIAKRRRFRAAFERDLIEAGLLVSPYEGAWAFLHRTFFEALAAAGLAHGQPEAMIAALEPHATDHDWREVILLAIAHRSLISGCPTDAGGVVEGLLDRSSRSGQVAVLLGEAAVEIAPDGLAQPTVDRLSRELHETMRDDARVPAKTRAAAGMALGHLGDPRFHDEDRWCLPDDRACGYTTDLFGFVEIPEGPFWMGSNRSRDRDAFDEETPQHEVTLGRYWIARWPVTVAQFRTFVEDRDNGGFQPGDPRCLEGVANHPVVRVSWDEAHRYCEWLTIKLRNSSATPPDLAKCLRAGWVVTLPSEAEWEKAAGGGDGRAYPWGSSFDQNRANSWGGEATAVRGTSAVGCFPGGASPYGVEELVGNVWEWTRSAYRPYTYNAGDGREGTGGNLARVVRGGSYLSSQRDVPAALRYRSGPDVLLHYLVGFRVVVSPFRS